MLLDAAKIQNNRYLKNFSLKNIQNYTLFSPIYTLLTTKIYMFTKKSIYLQTKM